MENGAFAQKEQMLHSPYYDNSKVSKGLIMEQRVNTAYSSVCAVSSLSNIGVNHFFCDSFVTHPLNQAGIK